MQNSIEKYLQSVDGAGKVLAHAKLLIRLARCYQELAPTHLAAASRLVNYTSGTVVIFADNNAVATKLRQLTQTLSEGLSRNGWECSGIQVKVQAPDKPEQSRQTTPRSLDREAVGELEKLRERLSDSPLGEAIDNLIKHVAKQ